MSGSGIKTGRWEVPGSIVGRACRASLSEFSVVFSETRLNMGQDTLERPSRRALSHSGPTSGQLTLILQPTTYMTKMAAIILCE